MTNYLKGSNQLTTEYKRNKERQRIQRWVGEQEEVNDLDDLRKEVKALRDDVARLAARQDSVYKKATDAEVKASDVEEQLAELMGRLDTAFAAVQVHMRRARH